MDTRKYTPRIPLDGEWTVNYSVPTLPDQVNPEFGQLLSDHLKAKGVSIRCFAKKCNVAHGWVARVARGNVLPSEENIREWAILLELKDAEASRFLEVGYLVRSHEVVQALVKRLKEAPNGQ